MKKRCTEVTLNHIVFVPSKNRCTTGAPQNRSHHSQRYKLTWGEMHCPTQQITQSFSDAFASANFISCIKLLSNWTENNPEKLYNVKSWN